MDNYKIDLFKPVTMLVDSVKGIFKRIMNFYVNSTMSVLYGAKYAAKRVVILVILISVVLWVSVLLYATFYHMYVPSASLIKPAYFNFKVCPDGVGMCSFPVANVTLSTDNTLEVLGRGQQYKVVLYMEVPDSPANRDVGTFMVISKLYDKEGYISQFSARTSALKYQSDLLKLMQTVVLSPLYITGFAEQTQKLNIELVSGFWDDLYHPAVGILLEIHSRRLNFYSAQIQFHACYTGLRYYLFYYPLTSALCGVTFNMVWVSVICILTWFRLGLDLMEGNMQLENGAGPQPGQGGDAPEGLHALQPHGGRRGREPQRDSPEGVHALQPHGGRRGRELPRERRSNDANWGYIQSFTMSPSTSAAAETVGRYSDEEDDAGRGGEGRSRALEGGQGRSRAVEGGQGRSRTDKEKSSTPTSGQGVRQRVALGTNSS